MIRLLKIILLSILGLLVLAIAYVNYSVPSISKDSKKTINRIIKEGPQNLPGKEGFAENKGVRIWYEDIQPSDTIKGTMVLFMGIGNDALAWPNYFLRALTDEGYRLIRFDTRGTGLSDWMTQCQRDSDRTECDYSLEDIAYDALTIMDTLEIPIAHMLGVSMGDKLCVIKLKPLS